MQRKPPISVGMGGYCRLVRGSRAGTALLGLFVVVLPLLSAGSSVSAASSGSPVGASEAAPPSLTRPVANVVFNDPATGYYPEGSDWTDVEDLFAGMATGATFPGVTIKDETVQVSMYRVADRWFADELVADALQGVTVQVLLDGGAETMNCHGVAGCVNPTFKFLEQLNTINRQPGRSGTWLKTCAGYGPGHPRPLPGGGAGCLGQGLNHNKFMLATQAYWGSTLDESIVRDAVLQSSSNSREADYEEAFNNGLVIANRPALYHDYQRYFAREAAAYRSRKPSSEQLFTARTGTTVDDRKLSGHDIETLSYPRAATDDPLTTALKSVSTTRRCANRVTAPGSPAHTTIDLGMFAINGRASAVGELADLAAAGCRVRIVYAAISRAAYRTLDRRNVHLQQLCTTKLNHVNLHQHRYYVHSKYLLIAGTVRGMGHDRRIVYTGSENLGAGSLTNDDNRDIRYAEPATNAPLYTAYRANFQRMERVGAQRPELGYACNATDNN